MPVLSNISIQSKILSTLGLFVLLCGFLVWFGSSRLEMASAQTTGLVNNQAESMRLAALAMEHTTKLNALYFEMLSQPVAEQAALLGEVDEERKARDANFSLMRPLFDGPDIARFATIEAGLKNMKTLTATVVNLIKAGDHDAASTLMEGDYTRAYNQVDEAFNTLVRQQKADLVAATVSVEQDALSSMRALIIAAVTGLLAIGTLAVLLIRKQIVNPINVITAMMRKLIDGNNDIVVVGVERRDEVGAMARALLVFRDTAVAKATADADKAAADATLQMVVDTLGASLSELSNRDLTNRVTADYPGAYGVLKTNFNDALENVQTAMRQVSESAINIRTGSGEIAQASEDLARRTEGNAASLEETSAALVQIDTRLKATALSSGQTVTRADQAIATVGGGRATAEQAVQAMGRVSESAKGIDSVIEGLDKIAFQTRVLAMNAAVEAGRAGDAGRGFAVVADLVSALAMRAEEEAKRARDQLTLTQTDIVTAVQAVEKVDGALINISGDVDEVHKLLGKMADDAIAQSSAITQITAAISAMDQSTQQNAAMVEETSAAARNLTAEVTSLAEQAAMFRTGGGAQGRVASVNLAPVAPARTKKAASTPYRSPLKPQLAMAGIVADDWNAF
ncbi:methyl-accepting chemotaxis protein [Sphingomonas sp. PAMC 26621]|uniref:methyl-accepting chemotaxis protein n=1 Tax=Sphingomonas sp. PAMC 26621 TaxID=1112213 RepID=UPI00047539A6|nr:methyl-accepting chemotaxis protein [Sphingomonas sp. PAMC 26621]